MSRYAQNTSVSASASREQIESLLHKHGCEQFAYMTKDQWALLEFTMQTEEAPVRVRITVRLPSRSDFDTTPAGRQRRSSNAAHTAWDQACRSRWRAVHLWVKAKLVAVFEHEISTIEREFLADIVTGDNMTVQQVLERGGGTIARALGSGQSSSLLLEYDGGK